MKIKAKDFFSGEEIILTATLTTEHPASSYGQPVMIIDEWEGNGVMDHQNWVLSCCEVIEMDESERDDFEKWHRLIEVITS